MIRLMIFLAVAWVVGTIGHHAHTRAAADLAAPRHCFSTGC